MSETQLESLKIDKAVVDDIHRLEFIITAMNVAKDLGYFERQFEYQKKGTRQLYIVSFNGIDAGYCILNWQPKYGLFKKLGVPEIQDLNVLSAFRRQGIATAVIAHCESAARKQAHEYMGIGVSVSAAFGPAQRLYTKLGYMPDGSGVCYDRKPTLPNEMRALDDQLCLMMMKDLNP